MKNNNKFRLLFIIFLAVSLCLTAILIMQGLSISDLKNDSKDLSNQLEEKKKELEEIKIAVAKSDNASSNNKKSENTINYDEDYIKFIEKELIPKIDNKEFIEICRRSSTYSMYICELEGEYTEDEGIKYYEEFKEIGERKYINGAEDINEFDLEYKTFGFGISKVLDKSGYILMYAGAREGMRIEEPWIEVLNYEDYGTSISAGGPGAEGIKYIFPNVKKDSEIEIKLSEDLAKLLEFDNDIIKINVK